MKFSQNNFLISILKTTGKFHLIIFIVMKNFYLAFSI